MSNKGVLTSVGAAQETYCEAFKSILKIRLQGVTSTIVGISDTYILRT